MCAPNSSPNSSPNMPSNMPVHFTLHLRTNNLDYAHQFPLPNSIFCDRDADGAISGNFCNNIFSLCLVCPVTPFSPVPHASPRVSVANFIGVHRMCVITAIITTTSHNHSYIKAIASQPAAPTRSCRRPWSASTTRRRGARQRHRRSWARSRCCCCC